MAERLLPRPLPSAASNSFSLAIHHPQGIFPVTVNTVPFSEEAGGVGKEKNLLRSPSLFPRGVPASGSYTTTVMPVCQGRGVVHPAQLLK